MALACFKDYHSFQTLNEGVRLSPEAAKAAAVDFNSSVCACLKAIDVKAVQDEETDDRTHMQWCPTLLHYTVLGSHCTVHATLPFTDSFTSIFFKLYRACESTSAGKI